MVDLKIAIKQQQCKQPYAELYSPDSMDTMDKISLEQLWSQLAITILAS